MRGETLDQTARRAGISPQYLSEIERGVKEPSSEMIAAITGALDITLVDLVLAVADRLVVVHDPSAARPTCQAAFALAASCPARVPHRVHHAANHRCSITWSRSPYSRAAPAVKMRSRSVSARRVSTV